ncbi:MAG: hypothetical protein KDD40_07845, partial [Bdellovibrionales bacterium]|nr:hypothetical protein [Bdellovibrionales bacterium]
MTSLDLKLSDKLLLFAGTVLTIVPLVVWNTPTLMSLLIHPKSISENKPIGIVKTTLNDTRRR